MSYPFFTQKHPFLNLLPILFAKKYYWWKTISYLFVLEAYDKGNLASHISLNLNESPESLFLSKVL